MNHQDVADFVALHQADEPLLMSNIWDAAGAAILSKSNAKVVATSSASIAWALGYPDGNGIPISELLSVINRICRVSKLPVTVDIEHGYSDNPAEVADLVAELRKLGVVGINIEDGTDAPTMLIQKIAAIRNKLGQDMFINARTDVYLRHLAEGEAAIIETLNRLKQYQSAGANGVFVPGLVDVAVIKRLVDGTSLPLNLMIIPNTNDLDELSRLGVKRFSTGPAPFLMAYNKAFKGISEPLDYFKMNALFGME